MTGRAPDSRSGRERYAGDGTPTWRRYRRPGDPRGEDGKPSSGGKPKSTPAKDTGPKDTSSKAASSKKSGTSKPASSAKPKSDRSGAITALVVAVVIGVPVTIGVVAAATGGGDSDSSSSYGDLDTTFLDEEMIATAIEEAESAAAVTKGAEAIELRVDEYGLAITYYDPNRDQLRTFEKSSYDPDTYQVQVEENYFDDYRPRPLPLEELEPAVVVEVGEDAIAETSEPYSYEVTAKADPGSGEPRIRADVSDGDGDSVVQVTDADGNPVAQ